MSVERENPAVRKGDLVRVLKPREAIAADIWHSSYYKELGVPKFYQPDPWLLDTASELAIALSDSTSSSSHGGYIMVLFVNRGCHALVFMSENSDGSGLRYVTSLGGSQ